MKNTSKNRGSMTIELALILPLYIVVIMFIMNLMNVYYIHAVVQQGLNNAGKTLAQYCYLIEKAGCLDKASGWFTMEEDTSNKSIGLQTSIKQLTGSAQQVMAKLNDGVTLDELKGLSDDLGGFTEALRSTASQISSINGDNVKDFVISEAANGASGLLTGVMVNAYIDDMKLDLKGIKIDYTNSKFLYGDNCEITLVAKYTYDRLFLLDFGFDNSVEIVQVVTVRPWIGNQSGGIANVKLDNTDSAKK